MQNTQKNSRTNLVKTKGFSGKFILVGEHFVLYDVAALALPWLGTQLRLIPNPKLTPDEEQTKERDTDTKLLEAWNRARHYFQLSEERSFPFKIESNIPIGGGFGSSAALCLALLEKASQEAQRPFQKEQWLKWSRELESIFHGRSSGIDPAIVLEGSPLRFANGAIQRKFEWKFEKYGFIIASSREKRRTSDAVAKVQTYRQTHPQIFDQLIRQMNQIVDEIEALISNQGAYHDLSEKERAKKVGTLLTRNHHFLRKIGVSSEDLERFVGAALAGGALGAKLTGAGLGGGMIAFAHQQDLPHLMNILQAENPLHLHTYLPSY